MKFRTGTKQNIFIRKQGRYFSLRSNAKTQKIQLFREHGEKQILCPLTFRYLIDISRDITRETSK